MEMVTSSFDVGVAASKEREEGGHRQPLLWLDLANYCWRWSIAVGEELREGLVAPLNGEARHRWRCNDEHKGSSLSNYGTVAAKQREGFCA